MLTRPSFWIGAAFTLWMFSNEGTWSLPYGAAAAVLFIACVYPLARWLQSIEGVGKWLICSWVGAVVGIAYSLVLYAWFGGWGPPFFFESMLSGAVMGGCLSFAARPQALVQSLSKGGSDGERSDGAGAH